MENKMITQDEFVKREISVWGEEYVCDLIERGYFPTLTDNGWLWVEQTISYACTQREFVLH